MLVERNATDQVCPSQTDWPAVRRNRLVDDLIEQLASRPDKGLAKHIFALSRSFSNEEHVAGQLSPSEHNVLSAFEERTSTAVLPPLDELLPGSHDLILRQCSASSKASAIARVTSHRGNNCCALAFRRFLN